MNKEKEKQQRILAQNCAVSYRNRGMSQSEFLEAVEMYGLNEFGDVMDALWALKDRGELEHLIALVWTWK